MGKKSELSVSQRLEIVLMILRKEEAISVLARRYGVSETAYFSFVGVGYLLVELVPSADSPRGAEASWPDQAADSIPGG